MSAADLKGVITRHSSQINGLILYLPPTFTHKLRYMYPFLRISTTILLFALFTACIGDDIVEDYVTPQIRITNIVSEIEAETSYQFLVSFLNNVGNVEEITPQWTTDNPDILAIDATGLATGITEGDTRITVSYTDEFGETAERGYDLSVGASTVVVEEPMERTGSVATTTFYALTGDFTLSTLPEDQAGDLRLSFGADYVADNGLPGLYVYLSNNPNTTSGAFEIGRVDVFNGAHDYVIEGVGLNDFNYVLFFCKPFNVKVGDGLIQE